VRGVRLKKLILKPAPRSGHLCHGTVMNGNSRVRVRITRGGRMMTREVEVFSCVGATLRASKEVGGAAAHRSGWPGSATNGCCKLEHLKPHQNTHKRHTNGFLYSLRAVYSLSRHCFVSKFVKKLASKKLWRRRRRAHAQLSAITLRVSSPYPTALPTQPFLLVDTVEHH
jgi:hypothetical protein